jgi:hypothetical protein
MYMRFRLIPQAATDLHGGRLNDWRHHEVAGEQEDQGGDHDPNLHSEQVRRARRDY